MSVNNHQKMQTGGVLFMFVTKYVAKATKLCRAARPLTLKAGH